MNKFGFKGIKFALVRKRWLMHNFILFFISINIISKLYFKFDFKRHLGGQDINSQIEQNQI